MDSACTKDPDCWYGIQDPAQRKKIQDRLAQRARRKRLAQLSKTPKTHVLGPTTTPTERSETPIERSPLASMTVASIPRVTHGDIMTVEFQPSVYAALFRNGTIMGMVCGTITPTRSKQPGPEIPLPLRPTQLQLTTLHAPWIDRFPFPRMRDNMISLSAIIEDEEFIGDLFCMQSFAVEPGRPPWDPKGWTIGKEFARKWGYLFY